MFITSQILIVLGAIIEIFSRLSKKKKNILLLLIFACCTYASSYLFLQGWAAAISFFSGALRSVVYYFVDKKPTKTNKYIAYFGLLTLTITLIAVFWSGPKDILMVVASVCLITVFAQNNIILIRSGLILTSICNLIFDIIIGSYMAIVIDIVLIITTLFSLIYFDIMKKSFKKSNQKTEAEKTLENPEVETTNNNENV